LMNNVSSPTADRLTFQLEVPPDLVALHAVQGLVTEVARLAGFTKTELDRFALIAEEGFVHTIRQLQADGDTSTVRITAGIEGSTFTVSFRDRGMPLGGEPEGDELDRLELMLIRAYCNEMRWIGHGKGGKELRILFQRPEKDITQYALPPVKSRHGAPGEVVIQRLRPEEADRIPRLVYRTYGYTYPNEDLYYPRRVRKLLERGDLVSIVARDGKNDEIAGHYAIEVYGRTRTAEVGQAAVAADYRGMGLLGKMRERVEEEARSIGLGGIYGQSVTSHTATQRINEKFGATACGISFGLVPAELNFRRMKIQPLSQRETCFYYFKNLDKPVERIVYPPARHREMIKKIYDRAALPCREGDSSGAMPETGEISQQYHASWGFGVIDVAVIGRDFGTAFTDAFTRLRFTARADVIFLTLPLEDANLPQIVDVVENRRFFFCGVAPYHFDGRDGLRFEYVNTLINTEKLRIYSEFGRQVAGYCATMMQEALA
jgi:GNAT superfamily N-acetyltransferase